MSELNTPETTSIRRAPTMDVRLAQAVRKLHDLGPRLVLELEAEIEDLQRQLSALRETAGYPTGKGKDLVGILKG